MNIDQDFHFWATGFVQEHKFGDPTPYLDGCNFGRFAPGYGIRLPNLNKRKFWIVSASERHLFEGHFRRLHVSHCGIVLELCDGTIDDFPFLLTTDERMENVFSGTVEIDLRATAASLSISDLSAALVVGESWLGRLTRCGDQFHLDAFSDIAGQKFEMERAYVRGPAYSFEEAGSEVFLISRFE